MESNTFDPNSPTWPNQQRPDPLAFGLLKRSKKELKTITRRLVYQFELEYGLLANSLDPKVVAYTEGGRKGAIWLPEGREGWGWSRILGELRQLLAFLEAKEWLLVFEEPFMVGKQKGDVLSGRS
jgi:hypothetical protein